jgi:hypothetical protein
VPIFSILGQSGLVPPFCSLSPVLSDICLGKFVPASIVDPARDRIGPTWQSRLFLLWVTYHRRAVEKAFCHT